MCLTAIYRGGFTVYVDFGFGEQNWVEGVCWHTVQLGTCVLQGALCASIDTHALCVIMCEINDLFLSLSQFHLDCMFGHVAAAVACVCALALIAH